MTAQRISSTPVASRTESGNVQRVGHCALSDDLIDLEKDRGNPVLRGGRALVCRARRGWIGSLGLPRSLDHPPRRPMADVLHRLGGGRAASIARGVVGIATSPDLLHWTPGPPVASPGRFAEIEVPQVFPLGDRWAMLFCTGQHATIDGRQATWNGTHYFLADSPFGPFELAPEPLLLADDLGIELRCPRGPRSLAGQCHPGLAPIRRAWLVCWRADRSVPVGRRRSRTARLRLVAPALNDERLPRADDPIASEILSTVSMSCRR